MAVQFNLLPDVKLEYIKAQRSKNTVFSIAVLIAGVAFVIFLIVLLTVEGIQRKQLSNADNVVTTATSQLKNTAGLDQIITVQNQLQTLTNLHHQKHATSRLFTYLSETIPSNVRIGSLGLDLSANTMTVSGTADTQAAVNTLIDTLKFTTYKIGDQDTAHQAFPSVVESSFSIASSNVNYALNVQFDPQLFSSSVTAVPKLTVPQLTTTRSVTEDPNNTLFNGQNGASSSAASSKSGSQ